MRHIRLPQASSDPIATWEAMNLSAMDSCTGLDGFLATHGAAAAAVLAFLGTGPVRLAPVLSGILASWSWMLGQAVRDQVGVTGPSLLHVEQLRFFQDLTAAGVFCEEKSKL